MEIVCTGCGKRYTIRDEKIPTKGTAYLSCPQCGEKIEIKPPKPIKTPEPAFNRSDNGPDQYNEPEFFEPGAKTALIYCPQEEAKLEANKALKQLNFIVREIKNASDIEGRFRYNTFDLVLLFQNGPDPEDSLKGIHNFLNNLEPERRKKVFVVYFHLSGNRYNGLQAFSYSVDMTLNPLDLGSLADLLPKALTQKEFRYKIFEECRAELAASAL